MDKEFLKRPQAWFQSGTGDSILRVSAPSSSVWSVKENRGQGPTWPARLSGQGWVCEKSSRPGAGEQMLMPVLPQTPYVALAEWPPFQESEIPWPTSRPLSIEPAFDCMKERLEAHVGKAEPL